MLLKIILLTFVGFVITEDGNTNDWRDVKISQGLVRGYKDPDGGLYEYYGIPYATAPTGPHRYRGPLPAPEWLGTFKAVNKNIICPQYVPSFESNPFLVRQDCLVANIFVPDTEDTNLPVIVYVHGGSFYMGYGNLLTPKNFVRSKNVIEVTFNYRLGALGFLCLGTDDVPGNAGLKDQVALLRWVKANIGKFGGNADDVTLAGYSAGSISVDLLMLSKMAEGLFTKVIPESGSSLGTFSTQINPLNNAKEFAKLKGFVDVDNFYALEDFYKNTPWKQLLDEITILTDRAVYFLPCVERPTEGEAFLSEAPYDILKSGNYKKLPMLYGTADAEGLLALPAYEETSKIMNENFATILPLNLKFETEAKKQEVAKMVKEFYFQDKEVGPETFPSYVNYYTDTYFALPHARAVRLQVAAGNNEIYVYEYSYFDKDIVSPLPDFMKNIGADHCAQSMAVLDGSGVFQVTDESKLSQQHRHVKSIIRDIWYNFVVTKKPVPPGSEYPPWPAADADSSPHMSLNESLELQGALLEERMSFWHKIYDKYYNTPSPPPALNQAYSVRVPTYILSQLVTTYFVFVLL